MTTTTKFDRAEKRTLQLIAERAAGGGDRAAATRAVDRLYALLRDPEVSCAPDRDSYTARADAVHAARVAAEETCAKARTASLDAQCAAARDAVRMALPLPGSYEAELYALRARG